MAGNRDFSYRVGTELDVGRKMLQAARDVEKASKSMQDDFDETGSKVKAMGQLLGSEADRIEGNVAGVVAITERLQSEFDVAEDDARRFAEMLQRAGVSAEDLDENTRELVAQMQRLEGIAKDAGTSVRTGMDEADDGVRRVHDSADQSRSVLANMVGNSAQDVGELGGIAGSTGVLIGQLAEYAADGNIAIGGLAKTIGPMVALAVGVGLVTSHFQKNAEAARKAKEDALAYADALGESAEAAQRLLAQQFVEDSAIRALQNAGADLAVLAEAARDSGDEIGRLASIRMNEWIETGADGAITAQEFADTLAAMGIEASPLTEELGKLADGTEGSKDRFREAADALASYSAQIASGKTELAARRDVERQFGIELDGTTDSLGTNTDAVDANTEAHQARNEAIAAGLPNELALQDAIDRSDEALTTYNEAVRDHGAASEEADDAGRALLESYLAVADAARVSAEDEAKAAGRAATATQEGNAAQIYSLGLMAQNLLAGSPIRNAIEDHIRALQSIPTNVSTTISTNYTGTRVNAGAPLPRFADGGRPRPNQPAIIGEEGPEVWVPDSAGTVIPNGKLGGAGLYIENLYAFDARDAVRQFAAEVAWSGRGGL